MADDIASLGFSVNTSGLTKGEKALDSFAKKGSTTEKSIDSSTSNMKQSFSGVKSNVNALTAAITALGASLAVNEIIEYADSWTMVNNSLKVVIDSEEELIDVRTQLLELSNETNVSISATSSLYAALYKNTLELGLSQEEVITVTETLNNLFKAGGKSAEETDGAVRQLTQGLASGALRGDEFNSVAEGAPRVLDALSDSLGIARGELRDFAATGGITSEILVEALSSYSDTAQELADRVVATFGQQATVAKNNITEFIGESDAVTSSVTIAGDAIVSFSENLDSVVVAAETAAAVIGAGMAVSFAKSAAASIAASIELTAYNIKLAQMSGLTGAYATSAGVATTATTALTVATRALLGPWGLLLTALGAAATAFALAKDENDLLNDSLDNQEAKIKDLITVYSKMTERQVASTAIDARMKRIELDQQILELQAEINAASIAEDTGIGASIDFAEIERLNSEMQELTSQRGDLEDLQDALGKVFEQGMPTDWIDIDAVDKAKDKLEKVDKSFLSWIESVKNAVDPQREFAAEIEKVTDAIEKNYLSAEVGAKRIEQLREQMQKAGETEYDKQTEKLKDLEAQITMTADAYEIYAKKIELASAGLEESQIQAIIDKTKELQQIRNELSQQDEYESWVQGIEDATSTAGELNEELEKAIDAMESGDLSFDAGTEYIGGLSEQIDALKDNEIGNPFELMTNGATEALSAVQNMTDSSSDSYAKLGVAMEAVNAIQAVYAVLNQGDGDPYTAFARMAAMAASVASLGYSVGSLSSSSDSDSYEEIQESQSLTEWDEKASSIDNSLSMLTDAADDIIGINSDMLDAMESLSEAISDASDIIAYDIDMPDAVYDTSEMDALSDAVNASFTYMTYGLSEILGLDIGSTVSSWLYDTDLVDSGIQIIGGSLTDLMDSVTAYSYTITETSSWWGSSSKDREYEDISGSVSSQFALVFESLADTVYEGALAIGFSTDYIESMINSFSVSTVTLSLEDMSDDEISDELTSYFSTVFNNLAESVVPWLEDLQDAGEELGDTLTRVATEVAVLDVLIDEMGVTFSNETTETYAKAADAISDLVGGVDSLTEYVSSFIDAFADDDTLLSMYYDSLTEALEEVGLALPDSADGMWELMEGIDASTDSGQEQIATLLELTETADAYYDILSDTQEEMADLSDTFAEAVMDIYDIDDAVTQVSLDAALAAAELGDFSLAELLDVDDYTYDESDFSTLADYQIAQAEAANKLLEISELAADEAGDVETEQLDTLNSINDLIEESVTTMQELRATNADLLVNNSKMAKNIDKMATIGIPTYE